ncbi:hypothetical protein P5673_028958 [Acropora cervicornis]|uniref:Mutator-like transposase domain-containing protein n=1 Tax=Acropora cervicornis TaxID=6130 RepID=A0AAD9PWN4_ACRCE|nr:hypothetical protein P5673_028958 [Acropora cervicornis]
MGWQKRGIIHILVMQQFCEQDKNSNKKVKIHDCRKNHNASSKAIEPASAVEMFNNAPVQKVKYAFYTGDGDSTPEAHIQQKNPYGVGKTKDIQKQSRQPLTVLFPTHLTTIKTACDNEWCRFMQDPASYI